jgi:predicted Na+-dependent transporter
MTIAFTMMAGGNVPAAVKLSIGLAATAFGPNAALMVALAFVVQSQTGAWFLRLNQRLGLFRAGSDSARVVSTDSAGDR